MKTGIELIAEERIRQVSELGWTPEHDDTHKDGALAFNAAILAVEHLGVEIEPVDGVDIAWFELEVKKKKTTIEWLTIAGALLAAEIDRIQRAHDKKIKVHLTADGKHVTGVEWNPEHWESL